MRFNGIDWLAFVLVIVGAVNWGLVGLFNLDLVALILGGIPVLQNAVYALVGLAGLYLAAVFATRSTRAVASAR